MTVEIHVANDNCFWRSAQCSGIFCRENTRAIIRQYLNRSAGSIRHDQVNITVFIQVTRHCAKWKIADADSRSRTKSSVARVQQNRNSILNGMNDGEINIAIAIKVTEFKILTAGYAGDSHDYWSSKVSQSISEEHLEIATGGTRHSNIQRPVPVKVRHCERLRVRSRGKLNARCKQPIAGADQHRHIPTAEICSDKIQISIRVQISHTHHQRRIAHSKIDSRRRAVLIKADE